MAVFEKKLEDMPQNLTYISQRNRGFQTVLTQLSVQETKQRTCKNIKFFTESETSKANTNCSQKNERVKRQFVDRVETDTKSCLCIWHQKRYRSNCTQKKIASIILVLWGLFYAIFCLTDFSSDIF